MKLQHQSPERIFHSSKIVIFEKTSNVVSSEKLHAASVEPNSL